MEYVGFWKRVIAYVVDLFCLTVLLIGVSFVLALVMGGGIVALSSGEEATPENIKTMMAGGSMAIVYGVALLYEPLFIASPLMATPGKMAVGAIVVKRNGERIGFFRAILRMLGKWLSGAILCLGFLMVAFNRRKRGLHDMISGTIVIKQ